MTLGLKTVKSSSMNRFSVLLLITLLLTGTSAEAAKAVSPDNQTAFYRRAFAALDAGHPDIAVTYAEHGGHDPVLNKILRADYMAQPGNDVPFADMAEFIRDNPDWPNLRGILAIAEQKIPSGTSADQVAAWFATHPPASVQGFYRFMDALEATGQTQNMAQRIRSRWTDGDFSGDELGNYHARYARFLDENANRARLDRLLWKNDSVGARRMYSYVNDGAKAVSDARLALANQNPNAPAFVNRVPSQWRGDPGFLYELLRWRVRNNQDDAAIESLTHAPDNLGKPEAWWEQRQTMIYRLMMRHDYSLAYALAEDHGQLDSKTIIQGEFLAGFLALRFLNNPQGARAHFQALLDNASTPVSRARGAYWLGRTYEVLNDKTEAEQNYETAAALNITYYGQLAATRLYASPVIYALPEPRIPAATRQAFFNRDLIRAVGRLHNIGEEDRARVFFKAATDNAEQRADFALLTELAYQIGRPDLAIEAAKAANQKNMLMASGGFPILSKSISSPPEPAFTHALIRQESMFNPNAASPAGAHGLMQLMPRTAAEVARKLGIKFKSSLLTNTNYNLRLGTTFIQNQLAIFDGSYVLALAGYNAGPRRVREWMSQIGDPRNADMDPIDWVEMIPVHETRNYVQRIIESLQVYRARLNGGQAPLMIAKDLRR